ncbi:MAG: hypothetical protein AB7G17_00130 [Phycisphaerales bacterium]
MSESAVERYTLRRKVFKLFGAGFYILNSSGGIVGYCKQKAFRLREDVRIFTTEACTEELLRIGTTQVIDFSASYHVTLPTGEKIGEFRRQGMKSLLRDAWIVLDGEGRQIAEITEDSGWLAFLRRLHDGFSLFMPEKFDMRSADGRHLVTYRTHFNPFIYRLGVAVHEDDAELDDLMVLAGACLLGAIEGRQD